MEKSRDTNLLNFYIEKYDLDKLFSADMTKHMEIHIFNKNEHICSSNSSLEYFYFFIEGKVKVYLLLQNGKSLLLRFYNPLKLVGDIELFNPDIASANVQTIEKSLCIGIPMDMMRKYAADDTKFMRYISFSLGYKLDKMSKSSSINLLYPLENRLASYILAINGTSNTDEFLTNKLTEIADLLGASYRHLNRTLNKLCSQGIIKKEKNSIQILDKEALIDLAGDIYT